MVNKSGESRHLCLVPNLEGNIFSFSSLIMMLAVGLSYMAFITLSYVPCIPTLLRVFIINGCWILPNAFSESTYMIMWFLSFSLFVWCIMFTDLWILYQPCIPTINLTWTWCMIFLMYCCIQFANILSRIVESMFVRFISLWFYLFLVSSFWFWN